MNKMNFFKSIVSFSLISILTFPAFAQTAAEPPSSVVLDWTPVPVLNSADGKFSIKLRGRVMWDNVWVNDSDNTLNLNATEFRSGRIGVDGKIGSDLSFRFEADFAHKVVNFNDITIQWKGPLTVKGGHMRFAVPMESSSSLRVIPLMERGGYNNAFGFGRQFGISFTKSGEGGMIEFGIGQGGFANHGSANTGLKLAARVTRAPKIAGGHIHLGASVRYREIGDTQIDYRYRHTAHQRLSPRFINTDHISDSDFFVGAEAGLFTGPFAVSGELGVLKANLAAPLQGQSDPTFWGGHINVSYFLTGEDSPYNPKSGTFGGPKLKGSVLKGGTGAVQLVARYDYVDLTDNGIFGGVKKTVIVGVNWWLAHHIKIAANYSHSDVSQAFLVAINGADGANKINAFGIRTQINW